MKILQALVMALILGGCQSASETEKRNPFDVGLNEPIDFANVTAQDLTAYAQATVEDVASSVAAIEQVDSVNFDNLFGAIDEANNKLDKANSVLFMLYWVSPDSATRAAGLAGSQLLDSLDNQVSSFKGLFSKMIAYQQTEEYRSLPLHKSRMVDDLVEVFKQSGVNLSPEDLEKFQKLNQEITDLTSQYSTTMNTANRVLKLDEAGADGLPENFKKSYLVNEVSYEIPVMPATRGPVMNNATSSDTRKAYTMEYSNRGSNGNMEVLDQLIQKRYELGQLMGYDSYAGHNLKPKMSGNPETVWTFLNDLIERARPKAKQDYEKLRLYRNELEGTNDPNPVDPWDFGYYRNQLLKNKFNVDHEKIREYLPMEGALAGMLEIYQQLLGFEFRKVENPSVWHEEVDMYEVYNGDQLQGRFYLDLFPRPNKESWFYCVPLISGRQTDEGYEVPSALLLGNFTRPTDELPSLVSHGELSTLFHEFGHVMDVMSYRGEYAYTSGSKSDFVEAMSQIFENWIWDYDMLSTFAKHYETGEVLPKELFDNMVAAKNVTSGASAIGSLRSAVYDMTLYDTYDPENPLDTDEVWRQVDKQIGVANNFIEGTHPQASWIHINGYPCYYYGYIWSDVYAQDMFTQFQENGLLDRATGVRYRDLILANGMQRDVEEAVKDFLGRPSNNEAYIKSLGL